MRIGTAIKAFFKALFDGAFAEKLERLLQGVADEPPVVIPDEPLVSPDAVQMLALLQREGRLVDFLQEDLEQADDAQVGAVVRATVYQGCRKAFKEYLTLEPVMTQEEETEVTIEPGFNASEIRLAGSVEGEPPFKGILRHRGWKLTRANLPKANAAGMQIVCPAEVELP